MLVKTSGRCQDSTELDATRAHVVDIRLGARVAILESPLLFLSRPRKGERELRCLAVYLPSGIDVRLFEGADFRRTQLVRDSREVEALADKWRTALAERGWNQRVEQIP